MKALVNLIMIVVNITLTMILLSLMWGWFIVPLGVVPIGYAHAFGLSLIVTFFQVRNPKFFKPELLIKRELHQRLFFNFGMLIACTLLGWITSLFM